VASLTTLLEPRLVVALIGIAFTVAGLWALSRIVGSRSSGSLVAADDGRAPPRDLISEEFGLVGRPDEIWRHRDGRSVPVEIKSREAPRSGVFASHRIQVEAYCLLIESTTGRSPPYGVVVYSGGVRRGVPWDAEAREEVVRLIGAVRGPYDGRATPSPAKCRGCRWRNGCDRRAA
jgi:CRISPR-associated exonuclease Cas4